MRALSVFLGMFFARRRVWSIGGMLLMLTTLLSSVALLGISGWFITASAIAGAAAVGFNFFYPSAGIRLFALTRVVSRYLDRLVNHEATFRLLADLRCWLFERTIPKDAATLGRLRGGDLLSRITGDIDALDHLYLRMVAPAVIAAIVGVLALGALSWIHPWIGASSLILLALAGIAMPAWAQRRGSPEGTRIIEAQSELRTHLVDGVQGLAPLRVFGRADMQHARIESTSADLIERQRRMASIAGMSNGATIFLSGLALWATLFLGIGLVQDGALAPPLAVMAVLAVLALFEAVNPLPAAYQAFSKTRTAAERLLAFAEAPPAVQDPPQPVAPPADTTIRFEGVRFGYDPEAPVLRDLSLEVAAGERVGLVGPSGAGKSTLGVLLLRLWDPQAGAVRIGGSDIRTWRQEDVHARIGFMSQRTQLFAGALRDNLDLAKPEASDEELMAALDAAQLGEFVRALPRGLDTWIGEDGVTLSGGQARRLALARVILKDAPILLLDEPTAGLDAATESALIETLRPVLAGKTVLMITHRPGALPDMDRIVMLDRTGLHPAVAAGPA